MDAPRSAAAVVVGAGLHGLATAWQLRRLGVAPVVVLERFRLGHDRGSSHGEARMTRSAYGQEAYARLAARAHAEEWPRLERESGRRLLRIHGGCFFGPEDGPFAAYARTAGAAPSLVERIDLAEARRRFPVFRFEDGDGVLHDHSAGSIAARETLVALAERCRALGVELREETRVLEMATGRRPLRVRTDRGDWATERCIVAGGPFAPALLPALREPLVPVRQTVALVRFECDPAATRPERFPVWAHLGRGRNGLHYGLPDLDGGGAKVGWHRTSDSRDDPEVIDAPDPALLARLEAFLARRVALPGARCVRAETCFYTNTPDEDFVLDHHPGDDRVVVAAGFSGHGFKFGPLTGRIAAELSVHGRSSVSEFESERARFAARRFGAT